MSTHNTVRGRSEFTAPVVPVNAAVELSPDPDMVEAAPVPEAEAVVVEVPVEAPELRYEYQPTDEQGRPLGGKQVIKYRTPDELATKLANQNIELVRKLREVTRQQRLGINDEKLPDDTEFYSNKSDLVEKTLSPEETFQLSQDLNDPAKFMEARDRLLESAIGASPSEIRERFNGQERMILQLAVKSNYDTFERNNRNFYPCPENKEILTDWMFKHNLAPTVKNFQLGVAKLRESGLILDAPIEREVTPEPAPVAAPVSTEPTAAPVVEERRIAPAPVPQQRQALRVPSGLHGRESATPSLSSEGISLTLVEFDKLSSDDMKKKLRDPAYAKKINELLEAQSAKK